jgi:Amt family ammonium transporter
MERALTVAVEGVSEGVSEDLIPLLREAITALRHRITELQTNISYNDEKLAVRVINMMTVATATASNSTNHTSGNHTSGNHTSENHTSENEVDSGSIAFMMFSTVLVLLMTTPGIMLYYSGMVRLQNALSTAIQAYVIASLVTFLWLLVGYSICFSSSSLGGVVGSLDKVWLRGVGSDPAHELASHIPEYVFCSFHLAFAIITPSLICGAFANRMKFWSVIVFLSSWHLIVYCPIVHCFWHPAGWLSKWGVQDFAGGCVVHISAGFSALISALMVGKRKRHKIIKTLHPHNKIISAIGACFLNVGWYGFNAGESSAT